MDIIARIAERSNGDILNIVQAASEMPAHMTVEEKLEAGYTEIA